MLERPLTRRTVLEHAATAIAGATGLGVADIATTESRSELDATGPDGECGPDLVQPDIAVVGARERDGELVVRAGEAVTFDASGTESAPPVESYAWDLGRETIDGERVHHAFERGGGVASVELTVTTRGGHEASTSVELVVEARDRYNEAPTPVHDVSPTRTYDDGYIARVGETLTFDARDSRDPDGDVVAYEWSFRGDVERGAVVEHTFRRAGNHEVSLAVTDDDGASESVRIPVHVTR